MNREERRATLQAAWDALSEDDRAAYADDYQFQVVSSHHDAGDHPFYEILRAGAS